MTIIGMSDGKYEFISRLVKEGKLEPDAVSDMSEKSMAEILNTSAPKNTEKTSPDQIIRTDKSSGRL